MSDIGMPTTAFSDYAARLAGDTLERQEENDRKYAFMLPDVRK